MDLFLHSNKLLLHIGTANSLNSFHAIQNFVAASTTISILYDLLSTSAVKLITEGRNAKNICCYWNNTPLSDLFSIVLHLFLPRCLLTTPCSFRPDRPVFQPLLSRWAQMSFSITHLDDSVITSLSLSLQSSNSLYFHCFLQLPL